MQKVKDDFQLANKEILSGNVYKTQNCFTFFYGKSCLTFKLSTAKDEHILLITMLTIESLSTIDSL